MADSALSVAATLAVDDEKNWISCKKAASILHVSTETIRKYTRQGHLSYRLTLGKHRRLNRQEVVALSLGKKTSKTFAQKILIYTRTSTRNQLKQLKAQTQRLKKHAAEHFKGLEQIVWEENKSGFNEDRPKLLDMLRGIMSGQFENCILLVEHKDRLARWNTRFIELVCEYHNVRVIYIEQNSLSQEEAWQHDLVSFITFYSTKAYSNRCAKRAARPPSEEATHRGIEILKSGVSFNQLCTHMRSEGFDVSENQCRKYIWKASQKMGNIIKGDNSGLEFRKLFIKENEPQARLFSEVLYEAYCDWAKKNGKIILSRRMLGRCFSDIRCGSLTFRNGDKRAKGRIAAQCYWGITIKGQKEYYISEDRTERTQSPIDDFLHWINTLKGQEITTRRLVDRYTKYCKAHEIEALTPTELYRACDTLCSGKKASDAGFLYIF